MAEFADADLDRDAPRVWWGPSKRARWREAVGRRRRERQVEATRYEADGWAGENGAFASVLASDEDRGNADLSEPGTGPAHEGAHDSSGASGGGPSGGGSADGGSGSSGGSASDGGSSGSSDGGSGSGGK